MNEQTILQMNDINIQTKNKANISMLAALASLLCLPLWIFALCLCTWSCGSDQAPKKQVSNADKTETKGGQAPAKSGKKVIVFYGDSLTAGYGLEEEESFPSLIEDKIDSLALDYDVVNAGLSGETSSGGLKRIDWVMRQPADIFFLELGANDMLRGLPLEQTRKNLSEIITKVQAKNPLVKIGLCEMMAAPNMGADYVRDFNQIFHDLAKEHQVTLVPFYLEGVAGHPDLLLKDGKHPNAEGQVISADNIWKSLEGML